jgi:hypothetical protein
MSLSKTGNTVNWKTVSAIVGLTITLVSLIWGIAASYTTLQAGLGKIDTLQTSLDSLCHISRERFKWDTTQFVGQSHLDADQTKAIVELKKQLDAHLEGP